MEEHVGVVVPGRGHQQGRGEARQEYAIADEAKPPGLPGEPPDRREDDDRGQLRHAGERRRRGTPDDRPSFALQQISGESPDAEHREAHHRRVGDEGAAEEDGRRRDREEERGASRDRPPPDGIRQTVEAGDGREGEHDRQQPADDLALAELPEQHRGDPLEQRELHAHHRIAGAAPVDPRIENVERLLGEVPRHVGVEDLTPSVCVGQRQLDVLEAEVGAEGEDEEQCPVGPQFAPAPLPAAPDRPEGHDHQRRGRDQRERAEDAHGDGPRPVRRAASTSPTPAPASALCQPAPIASRSRSRRRPGNIRA